MAKRGVPSTATDAEVRALLERHQCPVPFHEVRTRLLGNIATPLQFASPMKAVEGLWGGKMPVFTSIDAANVLIGALIMGLWNQLSRHQDRKTPFRLTRSGVAATRESVAALALTRRQELDGFINGLFGREESIDLPERAHRGLTVLGEMRALIAAVQDVTSDAGKPATIVDLEATIRNMRELTLIAEREIHAIVLSCKRAREQMLAGLPTRRPTLH